MPRQPDQIIGAFAFRHEGDGCLTAKYHNDLSPNSPLTEGCKRLTPLIPGEVFIGNYRTVWLEDEIHVDAVLQIRRRPQNISIFELIWLGTPFSGTGMLVGELLVGAYWD